MATVGNINIVLSATSEIFNAGLKQADNAVASLQHGLASLGAMAMSPLGLLREAATVGGMAEMLKSSMENTAALARFSDQMGVPVERLNGLEHAAKQSGLAAEDLATGMEHMLHKISEGMSGTGPAAEALERMHLEAKKLADERPDQAMEDIAESLKNVHNAAERTSDAIAIFGKTGATLLPMLMQGRDGLEQFIVEAQKLNPALNGVNAQKILAANRAIENMQEMFQGVVQTLSVELSPFLEAAVRKITEFGLSGKGATGYVIEGFEWVLSAGAQVTDWLEAGSASWQMWTYAANEGLSLILTGITKVLDGLSWLEKKLGGDSATDWGKTTRDAAAALDQTAQAAFEKAGEHFEKFKQGLNSKAATAWIQDLNDKATAAAAAHDKLAQSMSGVPFDMEESGLKKVNTLLDQLRKEAEQAGMSESEKKLQEVIEAGASPFESILAAQYQTQIAHADAAKKAMDSLISDVKRMEEETRTPLEKYQEGVSKAQEALKQKMIDLETFNRYKEKLRDDMGKEYNKGEKHDRKVGAEVVSVAYQIGDQGDWSDKLVDSSKLQLTEQKTTNATLTGMLAQMSGNMMSLMSI